MSIQPGNENILRAEYKSQTTLSTAQQRYPQNQYQDQLASKVDKFTKPKG